MTTLFLILFFIFFLLIGTPLYIVLFLVSSFLFYETSIPLLSTIVSFQKLQSQEFISAIPLFTFAGYILSSSRSPQRIINFTQKCFPFIPGSTSFIVIAIMALFTALTGASGVSILSLGGLFYPLLKNSTKDENFSHGLITASGSIGLLFAPSLPVIIYAIISNQNALAENRVDIETLFKVALLPSFIFIGGFFIYSLYKEKNAHREKIKLSEALESLKEAKWEIPLPLLIYGGIYLGWFTVLEASVITSLYTFVIIFIIKRELSFNNDFSRIVTDALKLSGGIFIIMATAFIFTNYIVYTQLPDKIFFYISSILTDKISFLISINILLLIAGCFLDIFSAILIILPLIIPIVEKYGIDPYHFAVIFLVNLEIGYITPPVGLNLFISSYRFKKPIIFLYRSTIPFLIIMLFSLAVITYVPKITTFSLKETNSKKNIDNKSSSVLMKLHNLTPQKINSKSVTFEFETKNEYRVEKIDHILVKIIDLHEEDISIITELGEVLKIPKEELSTTSEEKLSFNLNNLTPQSSYSIVMEIINDQNQGGAISPIIFFKTP